MGHHGICFYILLCAGIGIGESVTHDCKESKFTIHEGILSQILWYGFVLLIQRMIRLELGWNQNAVCIFEYHFHVEIDPLFPQSRLVTQDKTCEQ